MAHLTIRFGKVTGVPAQDLLSVEYFRCACSGLRLVRPATVKVAIKRVCLLDKGDSQLASKEVTALKAVRKPDAKPCSSHILQYLDDFPCTSPHGTRQRRWPNGDHHAVSSFLHLHGDMLSGGRLLDVIRLYTSNHAKVTRKANVGTMLVVTQS